MKPRIYPLIMIQVLFFLLGIAMAQDCTNTNATDTLKTQGQTASALTYGYIKFILPEYYSEYFYVVIDDDYEHYTQISGTDNLMVPVGQEKMTLITENYDDYTINISIVKDDTSTCQVFFSRTDSPYHNLFFSSYSWIVTGINIIIYTDEDSEVYINGELKGSGMVKANFSLGKYEIITKHKLAGTTRRNLTIASKRVHYLKMFNKPDKNTSEWYSLFPGASQLYKGEKVKGPIISGLSATSLALTR